MVVGPVGFSVEQQNLLWAMWRRGDSIREMERTLGETLPRIRRFLRQSDSSRSTAAQGYSSGLG
jgi:transposase, IS30 family